MPQPSIAVSIDAITARVASMHVSAELSARERTPAWGDRRSPERSNDKENQAAETGRGKAVTPSRLGCFSELKDELTCSICLDVCTRPCTTPCGHSFCRQCLRQAMGHASSCPKCRGSLPRDFDLKINTALWNTIQLLFPDASAAPATPSLPKAVGRPGAGRRSPPRRVTALGSSSAALNFATLGSLGSSRTALAAPPVSRLDELLVRIRQGPAGSSSSSSSSRSSSARVLQQQDTAAPHPSPAASVLRSMGNLPPAQHGQRGGSSLHSGHSESSGLALGPPAPALSTHGALSATCARLRTAAPGRPSAASSNPFIRQPRPANWRAAAQHIPAVSALVSGARTAAAGLRPPPLGVASPILLPWETDLPLPRIVDDSLAAAAAGGGTAAATGGTQLSFLGLGDLAGRSGMPRHRSAAVGGDRPDALQQRGPLAGARVRAQRQLLPDTWGADQLTRQQQHLEGQDDVLHPPASRDQGGHSHRTAPHPASRLLVALPSLSPPGHPAVGVGGLDQLGANGSSHSSGSGGNGSSSSQDSRIAAGGVEDTHFNDDLASDDLEASSEVAFDDLASSQDWDSDSDDSTPLPPANLERFRVPTPSSSTSSSAAPSTPSSPHVSRPIAAPSLTALPLTLRLRPEDRPDSSDGFGAADGGVSVASPSVRPLAVTQHGAGEGEATAVAARLEAQLGLSRVGSCLSRDAAHTAWHHAAASGSRGAPIVIGDTSSDESFGDL